MTPNTTKRQRLESAGYRHVAGWVPQAYAVKVEYQIAAHAEDVQRIAETSKPSGRPRKQGETE